MLLDAIVSILDGKLYVCSLAIDSSLVKLLFCLV